jgi:hypothetical protein
MTLRNVDLPAPDAPMTAVSRPGCSTPLRLLSTSRDTSGAERHSRRDSAVGAGARAPPSLDAAGLTLTV